MNANLKFIKCLLCHTVQMFIFLFLSASLDLLSLHTHTLLSHMSNCVCLRSMCEIQEKNMSMINMHVVKNYFACFYNNPLQCDWHSGEAK